MTKKIHFPTKTIEFFNSISKKFDELIKQFGINRNSKITNNELLLFSLLYTRTNVTQQTITTNINLHNKHHFDVSSIVKKLNNVPIDVYSNLFDYVQTYYIENLKRPVSYIAVDGVYNNTNINHNDSIETNMNLCLYDVINNFPINIILSDVGKKNNEAIILQQHIATQLQFYTNKCLICDRAYFSYKLFEYLHNNNIKFIIRVKKNIVEETVKKYPFLRIIRNPPICDGGEEVIIATNILKLVICDKEILEYYGKRWNIEEYFKHLKHNTKFQYITLQTKNKLQKHYYCIQITNIIKKLLIDVYKHVKRYKETIITGKNNSKLKTHINENHIMDMLYDHFMYKIVNNTFDMTMLDIFIKQVCINYNKINVQNSRTSKLPFTKWYIKSYHSKQNNMNENYSKKAKNITDPIKKLELKTLIKQESIIKRKRKELLKNCN